jgi:two-component system sensor histidine kinase SenX3
VLGAAVVAGVLALALGALAGFALGRRRARDATTSSIGSAAAPPSSARGDQPLASLVVEALDQGVIVLDRDGFATLVNPAARAMDVLNVDRLNFPDLEKVAARARDRGTVSTQLIDLPIGRLGREPIALSAIAVPLIGDVRTGRGYEVALLLADVSEQRRLEAVRRDFVANVSHELKTPVGALTLLAEAVQDAADDPETVARFASRMQHEGARLTRLVGDLMELSRVQGMDPMPGAAPVDVHLLCGARRRAVRDRADGELRAGAGGAGQRVAACDCGGKPRRQRDRLQRRRPASRYRRHGQQ